MAAPRRDRKDPNHKFMMMGEKQINIEPVFYYGCHQGHGNYMAGRRSDNKELLADNTGRPYSYNQIMLPNWQN